MERPRARISRPVKPRKAARWTKTPFHARPSGPQLERWSRAISEQAGIPSRNYDRYNVQLDVPTYDDEKYEKHLTNNEWTKEETDYLVELYRDCNAKWPVIIDRYEFEGGPERTMEDLKARFYSISATLLQLATPITSMTATDYSLYETLTNFNPAQETSRKKLAEGHLYRKTNEVDEETVLLGELQRIMLNQATLDSQREELRQRLDYPVNTAGGQQYTTFQQLTQLWQHLLFQDRQRKQPRMRPTGNPTYDGFPAMTPQSARPRDSITGQSDAAGSLPSRRPTRDSLPSATPQSTLPVDLSKADQQRFGVVIQPESKLQGGVTFASDKLSKPRTAKSTIQSEKIGAILTAIGVPDLIPIPTPPVIEQFEGVMQKVHQLLEMRKVAEKDEQELRVRQAEAGS
ncbi:SWR1-complex 4 [Lecanosticta acicola]|uniref:SWR1-complex protein 4 n=1 Tax=Lecanosticta acicola TaxID=111012 RepID=A0AAI8YTZ8_9PEZI|nr:SWR1-complex 4 [Lecanosticta acicola]